jgi:DNA-binding beta-propeller fold protein YncE
VPTLRVIFFLQFIAVVTFPRRVTIVAGELLPAAARDVRGGDGRVYVADTFNHRCQQLTSTGSVLPEWGETGAENGQFETPLEIAVSSDGAYVNVMDAYNNGVQYFYDDPKRRLPGQSYGRRERRTNVVRKG